MMSNDRDRRWRGLAAGAKFCEGAFALIAAGRIALPALEPCWRGATRGVLRVLERCEAEERALRALDRVAVETAFTAPSSLIRSVPIAPRDPSLN